MKRRNPINMAKQHQFSSHLVWHSTRGNHAQHTRSKQKLKIIQLDSGTFTYWDWSTHQQNRFDIRYVAVFGKALTHQISESNLERSRWIRAWGLKRNIMSIVLLPWLHQLSVTDRSKPPPTKMFSVKHCNRSIIDETLLFQWNSRSSHNTQTQKTDNNSNNNENTSKQTQQIPNPTNFGLQTAKNAHHTTHKEQHYKWTDKDNKLNIRS